jgi:hypothetical protein
VKVAVWGKFVAEMAKETIVLYFFQGEAGESIDSPNAFIVESHSINDCSHFSLHPLDQHFWFINFWGFSQEFPSS